MAFYRRGDRWRLNAIGQGYSAGLAAFAADHGIDVDHDDPAPEPPQTFAPEPPQPEPVPPRATVQPVASPAAPEPPEIDFRKVDVVLGEGCADPRARIDLRKGDSSWVLTVGLEWDGRGAEYGPDGRVTKYGHGDLDVYFFCRDEDTGKFVVISGEKGHRGGLNQWPFVHHKGDSRGPRPGKGPASEHVTVKPVENGDLLVNIYQAIANGGGAIDSFGRPRVLIRYGRPAWNGRPGPDADQITIDIGNGKNSFLAIVAHIDVRDGILTVDGTVRYTRVFSERMPVLDTSGMWVRSSPNSLCGS